MCLLTLVCVNEGLNPATTFSKSFNPLVTVALGNTSKVNLSDLYLAETSMSNCTTSELFGYKSKPIFLA